MVEAQQQELGDRVSLLEENFKDVVAGGLATTEAEQVVVSGRLSTMEHQLSATGQQLSTAERQLLSLENRVDSLHESVSESQNRQLEVVEQLQEVVSGLGEFQQLVEDARSPKDLSSSPVVPPVTSSFLADQSKELAAETVPSGEWAPLPTVVGGSTPGGCLRAEAKPFSPSSLAGLRVKLGGGAETKGDPGEV